jgi:hypothetical protein
MSPDDPLEPENQIADAIDAAEDIRDPLDGLVERTATDPGAPFEPDVLERLTALKKDDRAAFEALRHRLKKAGGRVTALDEAIAEESGDTGGRGPTQADILVDLAASAELFHTPDSTGFTDLDISGHRETWPIRAKGFRRWLARRFYEETGGAPSSEALQSALNVIEAKAHFDGQERIVHIRVGGLDRTLYLDLGDEAWRAVEIDATGWRVIENPPVRFRRASGMKPMPIPAAGGSVETLRSFLNVQSDADFVLVVAWALACLRNRGPYPVIVLSGEQGSAKSTFSAILRALIDPNTAPLRALPREDRDLFIAASNGHVLAFDNVSGLPAWISDTLCRLATGGGFAVRQLYSDQDEVLFDAARPVILNGIEDIVTGPIWPTAPCSSRWNLSPKNAAALNRNCGRRSTPNARASSACCSTRWRRAWRCCHTPSSKSCRAWRISRCGRRRAKLRSGLRARSGRPIAAIATKRSKA